MQPVNPTATRYDTLTILFHWLLALLVIAQLVGAHTIDFFPRGPQRLDAISAHITVGAGLAVIFLLHLIWRRTGGRNLRPAGNGLVNVLAKSVHWILNGLVAAMLVAGIALALTRADVLFGQYPVPAFIKGSKELVEQVQGIHGAIGWAIVAVAGLHIAAALVHRFVWKDGVMDRMRLLGR